MKDREFDLVLFDLVSEVDGCCRREAVVDKGPSSRAQATMRAAIPKLRRADGAASDARCIIAALRCAPPLMNPIPLPKQNNIQDDTLYDEPEIARIVRANIVSFLRDELRIPAGDVEALTQQLYVKHGTTMAGLVASGHAIDYDHYHSIVHATLDYAALLKPNGTREMIQRMRPAVRRHIFTNADANHTAECLQRLHLEGCFEEVWCFESVQALHSRLLGAPPSVLCKPDRRAFEAVLAAAGGVEPKRCVFVDDSVRNCVAAHEAGIFSVLVRPQGGHGSGSGSGHGGDGGSSSSDGSDGSQQQQQHPHVPGVDLVISSVLQLPLLMPALFETEASDRAEAVVEVGVPVRVPA